MFPRFSTRYLNKSLMLLKELEKIDKKCEVCKKISEINIATLSKKIEKAKEQKDFDELAEIEKLQDEQDVITEEFKNYVAQFCEKGKQLKQNEKFVEIENSNNDMLYDNSIKGLGLGALMALMALLCNAGILISFSLFFLVGIIEDIISNCLKEPIEEL